MRKLYYIGLCFLLTFQACENELDIPLDESSNQLTLNVELNPYDRAKALVTLTGKPLEINNFPIPKDAVVELFEEGKFVEFLQYSPNDTSRINGIFEGAKVPQPGLNYRIKVSKKGYPSIESSDKIPHQIMVEEPVLSQYPQQNSDGTKANIALQFNDPASERNYYQLYVYYYLKVRTDSEGEDSISNNYIFNLDKTLNISSPQMVDYSNGILFSDENFDGTAANLTLTIDAEPMSAYGDDRFREVFIFIELRALSESNYQYRKTLTLAKRNTNDGFSEPVLVWNNIQNGLGIMGSYTRDFKAIRLK